ncbi:MAG: hypothetical protein DHS20C18_43890 [Saprospiraceae bacterium]|nr:MAG: hypothetical protein DHS20C18_43890 [Saprospiraceae bacterium]
MKILKLNENKSLAKYKLDEYTTEFGSIIFDNTKGGSISNCYFFRLNKTLETNRDVEGKVLSTKGSFIDFYISKKTNRIQHIDFVSLSHFETILDNSLTFDCNVSYFEPQIDVSTWVSSFGRLSNFSYDTSKYLSTEDQVDVRILFNSLNIVKFLFGNSSKIFCLNERIQFHMDEFSNLTAIVIKDDIEVPKLINMLK